jgi:hypothetical protein
VRVKEQQKPIPERPGVNKQLPSKKHRPPLATRRPFPLTYVYNLTQSLLVKIHKFWHTQTPRAWAGACDTSTDCRWLCTHCLFNGLKCSSSNAPWTASLLSTAFLLIHSGPAIPDSHRTNFHQISYPSILLKSADTIRVYWKPNKNNYSERALTYTYTTSLRLCIIINGDSVLYEVRSPTESSASEGSAADRSLKWSKHRVLKPWITVVP